MQEDQNNRPKPSPSPSQVEAIHSIVDNLWNLSLNDKQFNMVKNLMDDLCNPNCTSWMCAMAMIREDDSGFDYTLVASNQLEVPALIEGVQVLIDQYIFGRKENEV